MAQWINLLWYNSFVNIQQIHFLYAKIGAIHSTSTMRSYARQIGWLADKRVLDSKIFELHLYVRIPENVLGI